MNTTGCIRPCFISMFNVFYRQLVIHPICRHRRKIKFAICLSHVINFDENYFFRCLPSIIIFMYKHRGNANIRGFSHTCFFIRHQYWPLLIPSIAVLFLTFCPQISQSLQINTNYFNQQNENPDRTVAKLGPRELQQSTTLSPSTFDDLK
jgi:hypothetical protein